MCCASSKQKTHSDPNSLAYGRHIRVCSALVQWFLSLSSQPGKQNIHFIAVARFRGETSPSLRPSSLYTMSRKMLKHSNLIKFY